MHYLWKSLKWTIEERKIQVKKSMKRSLKDQDVDVYKEKGRISTRKKVLEMELRSEVMFC